MTANFERVGRRLAEHHRKLHGAVGARISGFELIVFEAYCEVTFQRFTCLRLSVPHGSMLAHGREIAAAVLGKQILCGAGRELLLDWRTMVYAAPLDALPVHELLPEGPISAAPFVSKPNWVRWFDGRALAAGIGQQDGGTISGQGLRLVKE